MPDALAELTAWVMMSSLEEVELLDTAEEAVLDALEAEELFFTGAL